jgi:hypothetical protein
VAAPNVLAICAIAFAVVFAVLGVLAAAMRLITVFFPARSAAADAAVIAAISGAVSALLPGSRVTRIEEET